MKRIEIQPKNRYFPMDIAGIYFEQQRYEEALKFYLRALKMGNLSAKIGIKNVGNIWYNSGDKEKAQEVYSLLKKY